jgi:TPP-dependent pyruvate/acetoin dehydrogenase alpha subunit
VARARAGDGPTLIEADTMRMKGHAEHDDMKYVPREMLEAWAKRDPLARYEAHLLGPGQVSRTELDQAVAALERHLAEELAAAEASPMPAHGSGLSDVYADRPVLPPVPPLVREWEARRTR